MYTEVESNDAVTKEKLITDFKVVIADAEELLKATAQDAGEKAVSARARIEGTEHPLHRVQKGRFRARASKPICVKPRTSWPIWKKPSRRAPSRRLT